MTLHTIELDAPDLPFPRELQELLEQEARIRADIADRPWEEPPGGFHPSDYARVYATLHALWRDDRLRGPVFCEWGSGTGVITLMAELVGFTAYGIELQPQLVALADDLGGSGKFACGTFVTEAAAKHWPEARTATFLDSAGEDGHALLGLDPQEIDVVFCYPWPPEEEVIEELFGLCCGPGAMLVTYRGSDRLTVQQRS